MVDETIREYFEYKKKEVYNMLKECLDNVPYYKENWNFKLPEYKNFDYDFFYNNVPFLDKKTVREQEKLLLSNKMNIDQVLVETTSGSEGKPMNCYKSKSDILKYSKDLWDARRAVVSDITPKDKFVHFYLARRRISNVITNKIVYENNVLHLPLFNLSVDVLKMYWDEILKFKPRWMHGSPAMVYNLGRIVEEYNLPNYSFELVELTGEFLDEEKKTFIERIFNCKVTNQYGAREFWLLAYGCHAGKIHINDKSVFVESIYNDEYGDYELIITSLKNMTWPLVRYKIGDLGRVTKDGCNCNIDSTFFLELKEGRSSEIIQIGDKKISSVYFSFIARQINEKLNGLVIKQHQILRNNDNVIKINIVGDEKYSSYILKEFEKHLKQLDSSIEVNIFFVKYILPDNNTGKVKEVIEITGGGIIE